MNSDVDTSPSPFPAFKSDQYTLIKKIGEGGFGQVFLGEQKNTSQKVAIKILSLGQEYDDARKQRYLDRFERETLICAQLQHPNIVRLIDRGQTLDDAIFAVFEYVDGVTLKQQLQEHGPLSAADAADIMSQILSALAHAHERGVIHRDIKPANIMLRQFGIRFHASLLDFGIGTFMKEARQLDFKSLTLTQEALGTPSYSAPEQLRGEPPTLRTDLYVWGLVFLECLTGRPAVSGASLASVFHKQLSATSIPIPPSIAGHPIATLLRRVLNKKPDERTSNTEELLNEFNRINMSSLVGDLTAGMATEPQEPVADPDEHDQTIIHRDSIMFTVSTERKQITAMSVCLNIKCDAKNDTDFEVVEALHRDQKVRCCDTAIRYGAMHIGTLGDTLLFYFGYPSASDNDCRLSARAALEIISDLTRRNSIRETSHGLVEQAKIGIHTGMVTAYLDATPEGDTPNIAMELARRAMPNEIRCTQAIRKILEAHVEFEALAPQSLGVSSVDVPVFSLKAERHVEAVGFLRANKKQQAFIGREQEIQQLSQINNRENDKRPFTLIHGEAGIGKSRVLFEYRNRATDYNYLIAQCLPEYKNSALFPILNIIRFKYSLDVKTASESAVRSLVEALNDIEPSLISSALMVLGSWLDIAIEPTNIDHTAQQVTSPQEQKHLLFRCVKSLLLHRGASEVFEHNFIVVEDIHWADPTTIDFIAFLVADETFIDARTPVLMTSRTPLPEALNGSPVTSIEILKLNRTHTEAFIESLFDAEQVAAELMAVIVERTDGIPLFIEELVDMLKQKAVVHKFNGVIDFVSPERQEDVPSSLRDSLQQKLDALIHAKETAQLAATIGREFDYPLLKSACQHNEGKLQTDLRELVDNGLVYQQRKVDGDSYIFKHALVRDAAYESMLNEAREGAHRAIATALETHFIATIEKQPFDVARHYASAKAYDKAVYYGTQQVQRSRDVSANEETVAFCDKVLSWNACIGEDALRKSQELTLYNLEFPAVMAVSGFGSEDLVELSKNIERLYGEKIGNSQIDASASESEAHFLSQWVLFVDHQFHSRCHEAIDLANIILEEARAEQNRIRQLLVLPLLGQTYHLAGELQLGRKSCELALTLYRDDEDHELWKQYGMETKSQALFLLSHILACLGLVDEATDKAEQAIDWAKYTGCSMFVDGAYLFSSMVAYLRRDRDKILQLEQEHLAYHKGDFNPEQWLVGYSMMGYDWAARKTDHHEAFVNQLLSAGRSGALCWWEAMLAETEIANGQIDKAIERLTTTIARCRRDRETGALPLLLRTAALAHAKNPESGPQEWFGHLQAAIDEAQNQGAVWLERDCYFYLNQLNSAFKELQSERYINHDYHDKVAELKHDTFA